MPWDSELRAHVLDDPRAFVVGLSGARALSCLVVVVVVGRGVSRMLHHPPLHCSSASPLPARPPPADEAGAGANVALAVQAQHGPTNCTAQRLDEYIQHTLWGVKPGLPLPVSLQDHATNGIRASMFWVPTPGTREQGMPGYDYDPSDFTGW